MSYGYGRGQGFSQQNDDDSIFDIGLKGIDLRVDLNLMCYQKDFQTNNDDRNHSRSSSANFFTNRRSNFSRPTAEDKYFEDCNDRNFTKPGRGSGFDSGNSSGWTEIDRNSSEFFSDCRQRRGRFPSGHDHRDFSSASGVENGKTSDGFYGSNNVNNCRGAVFGLKTGELRGKGFFGASNSTLHGRKENKFSSRCDNSWEFSSGSYHDDNYRDKISDCRTDEFQKRRFDPSNALRNRRTNNRFPSKYHSDSFSVHDSRNDTDWQDSGGFSRSVRTDHNAFDWRRDTSDHSPKFNSEKFGDGSSEVFPNHEEGTGFSSRRGKSCDFSNQRNNSLGFGRRNFDFGSDRHIGCDSFDRENSNNMNTSDNVQGDRWRSGFSSNFKGQNDFNSEEFSGGIRRDEYRPNRGEMKSFRGYSRYREDFRNNQARQCSRDYDGRSKREAFGVRDGSQRFESHIPIDRSIEEMCNEDVENAKYECIVMLQEFFQIRDLDQEITVSGVPPSQKEMVLMDWRNADFRDLLLRNIIEKSCFTSPRRIQATVVPLIQNGWDIVGHAETGSGKTAAFVLPIINYIMTNGEPADSRCAPIALVLGPTRELVSQLYNQTRKFAYGTGVTVAKAYGQYRIMNNIMELERGCNILFSTMGRLRDFIVHEQIKLHNIKFFVLDEADRMLSENSFHSDIMSLVHSRGFPSIGERQTLLFSATFSDEVQQLAKEILKKSHAFVSNGKVTAANPLVEQNFVEVTSENRLDKLLQLLDEDKAVNDEISRTLVFVQQKQMADIMALNLVQKGVLASSISGARIQKQREEALSDFRRGSIRVLVATDVCARGIDVSDLEHVINYDLPKNRVTYVHRIGRTGRLHRGKATTFIDVQKPNVSLIADIVQVVREVGQIPPDFLLDIVNAPHRFGSVVSNSFSAFPNANGSNFDLDFGSSAMKFPWENDADSGNNNNFGDEVTTNEVNDSITMDNDAVVNNFITGNSGAISSDSIAQPDNINLESQEDCSVEIEKKSGELLIIKPGRLTTSNSTKQIREIGICD
ncbi:unnamed protein product [Thelazia callipaeda]|uniref:RNA helicase n=1 Tax=Thelazia callipaeda TaxID=103827 RepID=A0A0N5D8H0_THECL|nr:unnamed protein product [Thelazia callipaeda]